MARHAKWRKSITQKPEAELLDLIRQRYVLGPNAMAFVHDNSGYITTVSEFFNKIAVLDVGYHFKKEVESWMFENDVQAFIHDSAIVAEWPEDPENGATQLSASVIEFKNSEAARLFKMRWLFGMKCLDS
jgi:hypothetical protein